MKTRPAYLTALLGGVAFATTLTSTVAFGQTADDGPLSAIDWLSETVEQPEVIAVRPRTTNDDSPNPRASQGTRTPPADEDPIAQSATTPTVTVQPLGGPAPRILGLITPETSGLTDAIWAGSSVDTLSSLLMAQQVDTLPALQDLIITLAIAKASPPLEPLGEQSFLLARIDKLLDFGALEPALAMLETAGNEDAALFRRWFDVALLTGTENRACRALQGTPDIAPTPAARVFCLARRFGCSKPLATRKQRKIYRAHFQMLTFAPMSDGKPN